MRCPWDLTTDTMADGSSNAERADGYAVGAFSNRSTNTAQKCWNLSDLGGVEIRTRVLQDVSKSSPSAVCIVFLSPGDHADKTPNGLSHCLIS